MPAKDAPALLPMLRKLELRSTFTSVEIEAILNVPLRLARTVPGAYLVREGDPIDECCVIVSGCVYRHKLAFDGSRQILAIHFQGDLLGFNYGLLPTADHSVQSLSHAEIGFIPHDAMLALAAEFPNVGRTLWRETLVEASVAREWIVNVGQRTAQQRVAHLICELALRQHPNGIGDPFTIDWPITQEQLGDATGLTPVHVNRMLQRLRCDGLIQTRKRAMTILDWQKLQKAGDFRNAYLHLPAPPPTAHLVAAGAL